MAELRRGAALLVVLCSVVALVGCSTSETEPRSSPAQTAPASPPSYDVSRIAELQDAFPPGFIAAPGDDQPIKVSPQLVGIVGTAVSYGSPFTVDPPRCRPLLKPVDARTGADTLHIRGDGPEKRSISVGAYAPVTVPTEIPSAGCDRFTYDVDEEDYPLNGSVERLTAPVIDGAVTNAVRFDVTGYPNVEYAYTAILDGRVYVDVQARLAPEFQAEPVLTELLLKAVAAVRGQ